MDKLDTISILKDFGGWGALLMALLFGGRSFMTLARDFSTRVVDKLDQICQAITGQERRVDKLTERVDQLREDVGEQNRRLENLHDLMQRKAGAE